jgi:NADH dehydrogenase
MYDVSIISPENYFLFTPLLAASAVGTVEPQSIVEPVRRIARSCLANYICAKVVDVNLIEGQVICESGQGREVSVEYDYLVIAVGAEVNTFNIPGVEGNATFLKHIRDARSIRQKIISNFETALIPNLDPQLRQRLLTNVIVGGGPVGVEFAAELYDLIHDDLPVIFPHTICKEARVILVQSADHILNTYDLKISEYAESLFARNGIHVLTNARVQEVRPTEIVFSDKTSKTVNTIPTGLCVWATGVRMVPLIRRLSGLIEGQEHDRALVVDSWLRVVGIKRENVFALGDCATIELPRLRPTIEGHLINKNQVELGDIRKLKSILLRDNPQLKVHLAFFETLFKRYASGTGLPKDAVLRLVDEVENTLRSLPATAQVAQQEGRYLGHLFNRMATARIARPNSPLLSYRQTYSPFTYHHAGMAAYVGARYTILDLNKTYLADRFFTFWLWRSVYLSEQVSYRTRLMIAFDWLKTYMFGRDVSNP